MGCRVTTTRRAQGGEGGEGVGRGGRSDVVGLVSRSFGHWPGFVRLVLVLEQVALL